MTYQAQQETECGVAYLSRSLMTFNDDDLTELASQSSLNNEKYNITGYLWFSSGYFVQYIEGNHSNINRLVKSISSDQRHELVHKVMRSDLYSRSFPKWSMRLIGKADRQRFSIELFVAKELALLQKNFIDPTRCEALLWNNVDTLAKLRFSPTDQ